MHKVMDGDASVPPVLYHFSHYRKCDQMLHWLAEHGFTGKKLLSWIKTEHNNSPFLAAAFVLSKVKKETKTKPVLAERDFIIAPRRA